MRTLAADHVVSASSSMPGAFIQPAQRSARVFNALILLTFAIPFTMYFVHTFFSGNQVWQYLIFLVPFIGSLAGAHVFATTYLYFDRELPAGISQSVLKLAIIPLGIVVVNVFAVTALPLQALVWFMVFYAHYAMFHFGRQNVGVLSFSFLSTGQGPLTVTEKRIVNAVTVCGMCGALQVFAPGLMLDPSRYPFDLRIIQPAIPILFNVGAGLYAGVIVFAFVYFVRNRRRFGGVRTALYWMCVFWYSGIFAVPDYPLLHLALFTTAHGLQYLVFLGFHAYSSSQFRWQSLRHTPTRETGRSFCRDLARCGLPALTLLGSITAAWWIWSNQSRLFSSAGSLIDQLIVHDGVLKLGVGFTLGLTMAHYWVDQHIFRFKSPERRKWLMQRYPFLAASQNV